MPPKLSLYPFLPPKRSPRPTRRRLPLPRLLSWSLTSLRCRPPRTISQRQILNRLLTTPSQPRLAPPQALPLTLGIHDRAISVPPPLPSPPPSTSTRESPSVVTPPPRSRLPLTELPDPPASSAVFSTRKRLSACLATVTSIAPLFNLAPSTSVMLTMMSMVNVRTPRLVVSLLPTLLLPSLVLPSLLL